MAFWIILGLVLSVLLFVGTLVWWWVGDLWADAENKKFTVKRDDGPGPRVISTRSDEPADRG